jgi:hypothetical protein
MDNGKDLLEMVVTSYITPPEDETEDDLGHDYGKYYLLCEHCPTFVRADESLRAYA